MSKELFLKRKRKKFHYLQFTLLQASLCSTKEIAIHFCPCDCCCDCFEVRIGTVVMVFGPKILLLQSFTGLGVGSTSGH